MLGSKIRPDGKDVFLYRKILFDKRSEVYFVTKEQLENYKKNDIDRIIRDHQNGVNTMNHQLELAELISVTYDCFYGIAPTIEAMARLSKLPYIFKEYHHVYEDAWIANILRLLNSFKIGKGNWYGYSLFGKRDAIRAVKQFCKIEEKQRKLSEEYGYHMKQCFKLNHDRFHTDIIRSAQY